MKSGKKKRKARERKRKEGRKSEGREMITSTVELSLAWGSQHATQMSGSCSFVFSHHAKGVMGRGKWEGDRSRLCRSYGHSIQHSMHFVHREIGSFIWGPTRDT